jgi:hypothetical protein
MKPAAASATRITTLPGIRAHGQFGQVEEIAWCAERTATNPDYRLFYRRMARTARSFHVQLNLTDATAIVLLPDPSPSNCPSNLWHELDRAARHIGLSMPCAAISLVAMAAQGELAVARVELDGECRSFLGVPNIPLTQEEREWIESRGRCIEELEVPQENPPPQKIPPVPTTAEVRANTPTDQEVKEFAAVLRCLRRGRARIIRKTCEVIQLTGLRHAEELLARLQKMGKVRRLPKNEWLLE